MTNDFCKEFSRQQEKYMLEDGKGKHRDKPNRINNAEILWYFCCSIPETSDVSSIMRVCQNVHLLWLWGLSQGPHPSLGIPGHGVSLQHLARRDRLLEAFVRVGAHCRNYNRHNIDICYERGLDVEGRVKDTRTDAQKVSLSALVGELKERSPQALVVGHRELDLGKECPCFEEGWGERGEVFLAVRNSDLRFLREVRQTCRMSFRVRHIFLFVDFRVGMTE